MFVLIVFGLYILGLFVLLLFCLNEFNKIELKLQKERYKNKNLKHELKQIKKQYPLAEGYVLTKETSDSDDESVVISDTNKMWGFSAND